MSRITGWMKGNSGPLIVFGLFAVLGAVLFGLKKIMDIGETNKALIEERRKNDQERTDLLLEVRAQGEVVKAQGVTIKAQGDKLEALATRQAEDSAEIKRASAASAQASAFLVACFRPGGACAKAAEESKRFIEGVGKQIVTQVGELKFIVTEVRPGVFEAKQAPPAEQAKPCVPVAELGNVGLLPGVICATP